MKGRKRKKIERGMIVEVKERQNCKGYQSRICPKEGKISCICSCDSRAVADWWRRSSAVPGRGGGQDGHGHP